MTHAPDMRPKYGLTAASPRPARRARSTRSGHMCRALRPATAGPSGTMRRTAHSSQSTPCAKWRGGSSRPRLSLQRVGENFPHHAWQRRSMKIAKVDPAATLRLCGLGGLCVRRDLCQIDGKLQIKMSEGVLDESRHLVPFGL